MRLSGCVSAGRELTRPISLRLPDRTLDFEVAAQQWDIVFNALVVLVTYFQSLRPDRERRAREADDSDQPERYNDSDQMNQAGHRLAAGSPRQPGKSGQPGPAGEQVPSGGMGRRRSASVEGDMSGAVANGAGGVGSGAVALSDGISHRSSGTRK